MVDWPNTTPAIYATPSMKPKMGKVHLILGCDEISYYLCDSILFFAEERLNRVDGINLAADPKIQLLVEQQWRRLTKSAEEWLLSANYDDFNIHHCPSMMSYWWIAMRKRFDRLLELSYLNTKA